MLCSLPTTRSSPNWLDRLHKHKSTISESNPISPPPNQNAVTKTIQSQKPIFFEKEQHLFDLMTDVLSELFVMGDPRHSPSASKASRKQPNPKPCVPSASATSSADNSIAEAKMNRKKMKRMKANSDLSLCSGTVVTVIDTSLVGWKAEKQFRKGMVGRGREKKAWNVGRKKRKLDLVEKLIEERAERLRPLDELEGGETKENADSRNEICTGNINGENAKESDYRIQNPKRAKFLRSPRLPVKNASLFRLQVINRSPKSGLSVLRGTLKGKP